VSPDDVYQVRIECAFHPSGDGILVPPGSVAAFATVARGAGPAVPPGGPGSTSRIGRARSDEPDRTSRVKGERGVSSAEGAGVAAPVAAEVIEVRGADGLTLPETAAPGFVVPAPGSPRPCFSAAPSTGGRAGAAASLAAGRAQAAYATGYSPTNAGEPGAEVAVRMPERHRPPTVALPAAGRRAGDEPAPAAAQAALVLDAGRCVTTMLDERLRSCRRTGPTPHPPIAPPTPSGPTPLP
jgi:hypothetical protein